MALTVFVRSAAGGVRKLVLEPGQLLKLKPGEELVVPDCVDVKSTGPAATLFDTAGARYPVEMPAGTQIVAVDTDCDDPAFAILLDGGNVGGSLLSLDPTNWVIGGVIGLGVAVAAADDGDSGAAAAVNAAPVITSDGGGGSARITVDENAARVTTVTAIDQDGEAVSYRIAGGADAARFEINATTGVLDFIQAPDFEADPDASYEVQVEASDGRATDTQTLTVTVRDVNDNAPVITSLGGGATAEVRIEENNTRVTGITATDADAGSELSFRISGGADAEFFTLDASTGTLRFIDAPDSEVPRDANGDNVYVVEVEVSDGSLTDAQTIAVSVRDEDENENTAPVINSPAAFTVDENSTAVGTISASDADPGTVIEYAITGGADAALLSIDAATGVLSFNTAPDFEMPADAGSDNVYSLEVSASDGSESATQAITVTVNNLDDNDPVANDDAAGTGENTTLTVIAANGVLANDTDADGTLNPLTVGAVNGNPADVGMPITLASGATLTLGADGAYTYNPGTAFDSLAQGASTTDSFNYAVSDGSGPTDTATVTITINGVNDAPVLANISTLNYTEGDGPEIVNDNLSLTDVDSATLTGATVTLAGAGFDATQDLLGFVNQNGIIGTYDAVTGLLTLMGSASLADYQAALRSVTYENTSANPDTGARTVSFVVTDGAMLNSSSNTIVSTLTVNAENDAPVVTATAGALGYTENDAATAVDPGLVVSDADSANLVSATVQITGGYVNGQDLLGFTNQNGITGSFDAGTGTLTLSGTASVAAYQAAMRSVTYLNNSENPNAADRTASFTVSDGLNSSNIATRTLDITAVNDAPVITSNNGDPLSLMVTENTPTATVIATVTATDVDGPGLSYSLIGTDAADFTINSSGEIRFSATPDFEAPADADTNNVYSFSVRVFDGTDEDTQAFTVTVTDVDENLAAPVFQSPATFDVDENTTAVGTVLATDADSPTVTYSITGGDDAALFSIDPSSGALSFNTAPDFEAPTDVGANNTYQLTVTASDGTNSTPQAITVTVNNLNDNSPVANVDSYSMLEGFSFDVPALTGVLSNDTDADGDDLQAELVSGTANVPFILSSTGAFNYAPDPNFNGSDSFQYRATDGTFDSAPVTVTLIVTPVNDAPSGTNATLTLDEDTTRPFTAADFGFSDPDDAPAANSLQAVILTTLPAAGTLMLSGGAVAAGQSIAAVDIPNLAYTPALNANGLGYASFTFQVVDNGGTANGGQNTDQTPNTLTFNVTPVNDAPVITNGDTPLDLMAAENTPTATVITTIAATDVDTPLNGLTYSLIGTDAADFTINSSGEIRFAATPDFEAPADADTNNVYNFSVRVFDGTDEDTQAVTVTVTDTNEAISVLPLFMLNGANGFRIDGELLFDFSGQSASNAGDVNGDGFDDLIVGAPLADAGGGESGISYVVFGQASGFPAAFQLASLDGNNGFRLGGVAADDESGRSVSSAGDVNGDGYDDLIVGALNSDANGSQSGSSYVVFGRASGFAALTDLDTLDGSDGFRLDGAAVGDRSGLSVAGIGDFNGDGYDDLIVGSPEADPNGIISGSSYVVFGRASGFDASIDLAALDVGAGFRLEGAAQFDRSGWAVSGVGDINGDGFNDLIIGAYGADPNGSDSGATYIVFGQASGFPTSLNVGLLDGNNGFQLEGVAPGDASGRSVASAGDVNGDGYDDLIIGAPFTDINADNSGSSYVLFGQASGFAPTVNLGTLDGTNGFRLDGVALQDGAGFSVSGAGDFNGDGYDDLIVGAPSADVGGGGSGSSYVVFGMASGFAAAIDLGLLDGSDGLRLDGELGSGSGISVSGAGDVNGDGYDDLIVGASNASPNMVFGAGSSYVAFGFATQGGNIDVVGTGANNPITLAIGERGVDGGGGNDTLTGNAADNTLIGGQGNDTLNGAGGNDVLIGGAGDDILVYDLADTLRVDGGTGRDTLRIDGSGVHLNLTALNSFSDPGEEPANPYSNIEIIDLTGSGNNTLTLNAADLLRLVDAATDANGGRDQNLLRVDGNASDAVVTGTEVWVEAGRALANGSLNAGGNYTLYTSGSAQLLVQNTVDRSGIQTTTATILVADLDGSNGFRIDGVATGDFSGRGLSSGDVDGDGYDDVVIGAPYGGDGGQVYVVFGGAGSSSAVLPLAALGGGDGLIVDSAVADDFFGLSLSAVGDFNGDGFRDVLIGARGSDITEFGAGQAYLIYGDSTGNLPASLDVAALPADAGFRISPELSAFPLGVATASGDFNGDGYDDLLIGANQGSRDSDVAYVVFGRPDVPASPLDLASLNGSNGFAIDGVMGIENLGQFVGSAGDVNGDGYDDFLIGADAANLNNNPQTTGVAYLVFGRPSGFPADFPLANLALSGSGGFQILGATPNDGFGRAVSGIGDLNGDGYQDFAIGADFDQSNTGSLYVVFGGPTDHSGSLDVSTLDGSNGFRLEGVSVGRRLGSAVEAAGDVNGDGIDDLLVAANLGGTAYVVFGTRDGFDASLEVSAINGLNGFRVQSPVDGRLGAGLAGGGDINGDGFDDLVLGSYFSSISGAANSGSTYVVYGFSGPGGVIDVVGTDNADNLALATGQTGVNGGAGHDTLTGNAGNNSLIGGLGDDLLHGADGADVLIGGAGNDVLIYDLSDTRIDGGTGLDTLRLTDGDSLDLTALADGLITGIERIDLETDAVANTVDLALRDLLALSDSTNDLYLIGNNNDVVDLGAEFVDSGTNVSVDGRMFDLYTVAGTDAQLFIEQGLQVV